MTAPTALPATDRKTCEWATCRKQATKRVGGFVYCDLDAMRARDVEMIDLNDGTKVPPRPLPAAPPQPGAVPAQQRRPSPADLIEPSLEHDDPDVRRAAERAKQACDGLVEALQQHRLRLQAARHLDELERLAAEAVEKLNEARRLAGVRGAPYRVPGKQRQAADRPARAAAERTPAQQEALRKAQQAAKDKRDQDRNT